MPQISLEEAAARLPQLVAEAEGGEDIILMQNNQPVARLVSLAPLLPRQPRVPGSAAGIIVQIADDFDATPDDFRDYI